MSKKVKHQESTTEEVFKNLEETASRSEKFVEDHKNIIMGVIAAVVLLIGGYMAFQNYYITPMEKEATNELFNAKLYFEKDSLNLALNGDGQYKGFVDIADEYSMTKTGNLAKYYAGLSYYKLGDYQNAISYLDGFKSEDKMVGPIAKGVIGDAFVALGQFEDAFDYYLKAANLNDNEFTAPIYLKKAGDVAMKLENYSKAADLYSQLKEKYPKSSEGAQADKLIARAKASNK